MYLGEKNVLNSAKTLSRLLDDRSFVKELYQTFLFDADVKIKSIQQAANDSDFEELARAAHRLKGACSAIDAERLFSWAWQLELAAKASDENEVGARMPELGGEWELVRRELTEWLES